MARERSRAYPAYSLRDAVDWAGAVQKNIGRGVFDRDMSASSFGSAAAGGTVPRKVATMVQFGILDLQRGGYRLSDLGMKIVMPCNDLERKEAIAEAFRTPSLYRDVLARFAPDGGIPTQLANILVREFRIAPPAAPSAVRVFLDSGRYASVLNDDNEIIGDVGAIPGGEDLVPADDDPADVDRHGYPGLIEAPLRQPEDGRASGRMEPSTAMPAGQQVQELRLSKGTARLIVPDELSSRDIRLLQKMLEVWALQVELLQEAHEEPGV